MRIALIAGATTYPLAGEDGVDERVHSSAGDFRMAPVASKQELPAVRADYLKVVDRGNLMHTVEFSTSREFATPAEAFLYCLDYDGAVPRAGVLEFEAVAPGGTVSTRQMADAVVDPPRRRVIGCTVLLDYTATGGEITTPA